MQDADMVRVERVRLDEGDRRYLFTYELPAIDWMPGEDLAGYGMTDLRLFSPRGPLDLVPADPLERAQAIFSYRCDMQVSFLLPPEPVAEPATFLLLAGGLGALLWGRAKVEC